MRSSCAYFLSLLEEEQKNLFLSLPRNTIASWVECTSLFMTKFFPPTKTMHLGFNIRDFYFCAPGSLVVLTFPSHLTFPHFSPRHVKKPSQALGQRDAVRSRACRYMLAGG